MHNQQAHSIVASAQSKQHRHHHRRHHRVAVPRLADAVAVDGDLQAFSAQAPDGAQALSLQKKELQQERQTIFKSVQDVASGLDDGVSLHHRLSNEKVKVSHEEQNIGHLRKKAENIRKAHHAAARKLHTIMTPRILLSEQRLEKKRASVAKKKQVVQHWEELRADAHAKAVEAAEEQSGEAKRLAEAREEVQKAMKQEEEAKKRYSTVEKQAASKAMAFQFADTKLSASKTDVAREIQDEEAMEEALRKARMTLTKEELHFDEELVTTEDKLEKKIDHAEVQKEHAERQFFATKDEFLAWQASQKERAREVAALKSDFESREKALYKTEQRGYMVGKAADGSAVVDANSQEDWAWGL